MAYLDLLRQLSEAGILGDGGAPVAVRSSGPGGEDAPPIAAASTPPVALPSSPLAAPAPAPEPPSAALPTDFPAGLQDQDIAAAQRADHGSRLALSGANAMLAASGVPGGGFAMPDRAGELIARRKALLDAQKLQEGAIDLAGKRTALDQAAATRQAMLSPAVTDAQRQEIAWDMASSRKGGAVPTPEEIAQSAAVIAKAPPLALSSMAEQAMARNKERAANNAEFAKSYASTASGKHAEAEAGEVAANAKAERSLKGAQAEKARAEAAMYGAGSGDSAGGLSSGATETYAYDYIKNGKGALPSGQGPRSIGQRTAIVNRANEIAQELGISPDDFGGLRADQKANIGAMQQNSKTLTAVRSFNETLELNAQGLIKSLDGLPGGNQRWLNAPIRNLALASGDPKVSTFLTWLEATRREASKLQSGSLGNAPVTDSAAHAMNTVLSENSTPGQIVAAINVLTQEGQNRISSLENEHGRIKGAFSVRTSASPSPGKGSEPLKATHRFNPKTGKIEAIP